MVNNPKNFRISKGGVIDFFDHFVVINPKFYILKSWNWFYIFFPRVISSLFISPIWPGPLYFLIGFIIYTSSLITPQKNLKILCVRSIQEFTILCVHTNTCSRHRFLGNPITNGAIYNFGHSVRGRAIGT